MTQSLIEVMKNPLEWKYVEQILPKPTAPTVVPKECYSSGWTPQWSDARKVNPNSLHVDIFGAGLFIYHFS